MLYILMPNPGANSFMTHAKNTKENLQNIEEADYLLRKKNTSLKKRFYYLPSHYSSIARGILI